MAVILLLAFVRQATAAAAEAADPAGKMEQVYVRAMPLFLTGRSYCGLMDDKLPGDPRSGNTAVRDVWRIGRCGGRRSDPWRDPLAGPVPFFR